MPSPMIKWYHKKWFVVLMMFVFFPIGLVLLWTSPVTKTSGRLVWSLICAIGLFAAFGSGNSGTPSADSAATAPAPAAADAKPAAAQPAAAKPAAAKPAAAPKDEYPFKLNDKSSGKVYQGKMASNVGVAITDVTTATTVGTNEYAKKSASSGAVFVVVKLGVTNQQKDAVMMNGSLFKILADGREYSYSSEAETAIMIDEQDSFFLKQINPGLTARGTVAFEVPEGINLDSAKLQFQGGMIGKSDTLPLKAITQ